MLDLEFSHAAAPGHSAEDRLFVSEFRFPPQSQPRRSTGGIWLFAMADVAHRREDPTLDLLVHGFRDAPAQQSAGVTFSRLFQDANLQAGVPLPAHSGVVACGLCFDRVVVAHSGGAGCYLVRQRHATRLTLSNVDVIDYQVQPGDVLILGGETMHQAVKGSEMAAIAGHGADLKMATHRLLELALEREPRRGMSLAAIRVLAVEKSTQARGRAQVGRL